MSLWTNPPKLSRHSPSALLQSSTHVEVQCSVLRSRSADPRMHGTGKHEYTSCHSALSNYADAQKLETFSNTTLYSMQWNCSHGWACWSVLSRYLGFLASACQICKTLFCQELIYKYMQKKSIQHCSCVHSNHFVFCWFREPIHKFWCVCMCEIFRYWGCNCHELIQKSRHLENFGNFGTFSNIALHSPICPRIGNI